MTSAGVASWCQLIDASFYTVYIHLSMEKSKSYSGVLKLAYSHNVSTIVWSLFQLRYLPIVNFCQFDEWTCSLNGIILFELGIICFSKTLFSNWMNKLPAQETSAFSLYTTTNKQRKITAVTVAILLVYLLLRFLQVKVHWSIQKKTREKFPYCGYNVTEMFGTRNLLYVRNNNKNIMGMGKWKVYVMSLTPVRPTLFT